LPSDVQTILRPRPHSTLWTVDDVGGDLLAAMRREAVEEDRVVGSALHQAAVTV